MANSLRLKINDEVDVLAVNDWIYCPAKVVQVKPKIKIDYKGWNDGEVRWYSDIDDEARLKPAGTCVTKTKAWVRIKSGTCYWPSIVYIRRPYNEDGVTYLQEEPRVFIEPFGEGKLFLRPYINGMWIRATSVSPFEVNNARRRRLGLNAKTKALSELFDDAMRRCDESKIPEIYFNFDGTFDCSHLKKKGPIGPKPSQSLIRSSTTPISCPDVTAMFESSQKLSKRMIDGVNLTIQSMQSLEEELEDKKRSRLSSNKRKRVVKKSKSDHKEVIMRDLAGTFLKIANSKAAISTPASSSRPSDTPVNGSTSKSGSPITSHKRRSSMPPQKVIIKIEK